MRRIIKDFLAIIIISAIAFSLTGCMEKASTDGISETSTEIQTTMAPQTEVTETEITETTVISTERSQIFIVNTKQDDLRLRDEPTLDGKIVDKMPKGAEVTVISEDGEWLEISYNGIIGWAKSEFLIEKEQYSEQTEEFATEINADYTDSNNYNGAKKDKTTTTTKKATTTKATTRNTRPQTPATVYIHIHGKTRNKMGIMKKVYPGESYTLEMARRDVARKYPGESFTMNGDSVVNYDPETGIRNFHMNAYFGEARDSVAAGGAR